MVVVVADSAVTAMFTLVLHEVHITVKVVATDNAVATLVVAIAVTLMCTSLSQHCHYHCCHNAVLIFAATALCSVFFAVMTLCLFSLRPCCAHFCCHSAVLSLFCCHDAVLVFTATVLCSFSLPQRCAQSFLLS